MKKIKFVVVLGMITMMAACRNPNNSSDDETVSQDTTQQTSETTEETEEPEETVPEESPWILVVKDTDAGVNGNAGIEYVYVDENVANPFAALVSAGTIQLELVGKRELKTRSVTKWLGTSETDKINVINQYKVYVHKDAAETQYFLEDDSLEWYSTYGNGNSTSFRFKIIKDNSTWKMSVIYGNSSGADTMVTSIIRDSYRNKTN